MLGFFTKKNNKENDDYDPEKITLEYKGDVISCGDYEAFTLNRDDPSSNQEYPYHMFTPDGFGKITYKDEGKIIEQYEGEFEAGQYNGKGRLFFKGKIFEGIFKANKFVKWGHETYIAG